MPKNLRIAGVLETLEQVSGWKLNSVVREMHKLVVQLPMFAARLQVC